jgi:hypothetical protein
VTLLIVGSRRSLACIARPTCKESRREACSWGSVAPAVTFDAWLAQRKVTRDTTSTLLALAATGRRTVGPIRPFTARDIRAQSEAAVFGNAATGDAWAIDAKQATNAVVVIDHAQVWEGDVESPRGAMRRVAANLDAALNAARRRALASNYHDVLEEVCSPCA